MDFLHHVEGVVILNQHGQRVFAKYYVGEDVPEACKSLSTVDKQRQLEQAAHTAMNTAKHNKFGSAEADITIIDGHAIVFLGEEDCSFLVIGNEQENALVLFVVLRCLVDALKEELHAHELNSRFLLENYEAILLSVDEMLDEGIIMETSAEKVAEEVNPYLVETPGDSARIALSTVNQYLRENL